MHVLFDVLPGVDPGAARTILAGVLTLAGATVTATIIAGIIQLAKGIPTYGALLDAGREYVAVIALWAFLIVYAVLALGLPTDLVSIFGYFLAWLGGAKLSTGAYDLAATAKAKLTGT